jgi:tetratricopeptide (TPR) repeat protein
MRGIYQCSILSLLLVRGIAGAEQVSWEALMRRGDELSVQGKFGEAETALLSALKVAEALPPDLRLAETQHVLGTAYRELGRLPEAERWYQRSLSTWKASVSERDPSLAKPLISLTSLYLETGSPGRAERLLDPWLRVQPADPADSLSVRLLHNLAALLYAQRRYSRAEELYGQALKAAETVFGSQSQEVALLRNNLGMLLAKSGKRKEAGAQMESTGDLGEHALS